MRILILLAVILHLKTVSLTASVDEERLARRIQAHLTIKDHAVAIEEARQALILFPESRVIYEGYIRALAKAGEERKLLQVWDIYNEKFPSKLINRELIEDIAWGILNKASKSSSIIMREMALLAAFFSQEAQGVAILNEGMKDSNYAVRAVAVKLAASFRDQKLITEIKRLFKEEKTWSVRKRVIEAIGKMKIVELKSELEDLIASEESLAGEKALAIKSLLELLETVNRAEIERLSLSNRAGLRQLACKAIAYFNSTRDVDQLLRLAEDSHSVVRLEAFQAIGQLHPTEQIDKIFAVARKGCKDMNYRVALSATWLLTLYAPEEGKQVFAHFLNDGRQEVRIMTAAALNSTGHYGLSLALNQFRMHSDAYVRLNLALGLIGQRKEIEESSTFLKQMLINDKEKWSALEVGIFSGINNKPSKKSVDAISNPESDNQILRLELLNLLSILNTPGIQFAIREYLLERSWEISATATALLLTEGDESAIEVVQQLLQDQQSRVRLQAALILSLWSRDESAIQVLEEGYLKSDWEQKARILEGLGRIGSIRSIPFLLDVLKEPSQTLRLIASMALIQCLNH